MIGSTPNYSILKLDYNKCLWIMTQTIELEGAVLLNYACEKVRQLNLSKRHDVCPPMSILAS